MDAQYLEGLRECKVNLEEVLAIQTRSWCIERYKNILKKSTADAKIIIATMSNYLVQLQEELGEFKEILRQVNIKMATQVLDIAVKGLFTDGSDENYINSKAEEDSRSLKSDEFRFNGEEAEMLMDRQIQLKLNLDIKKSIIKTRKILDTVDSDISVNMVEVETLEDLVQKWAVKLLAEEEASKPSDEFALIPEEENAQLENTMVTPEIEQEASIERREITLHQPETENGYQIESDGDKETKKEDNDNEHNQDTVDEVTNKEDNKKSDEINSFEDDTKENFDSSHEDQHERDVTPKNTDYLLEDQGESDTMLKIEGSVQTETCEVHEGNDSKRTVEYKDEKSEDYVLDDQEDTNQTEIVKVNTADDNTFGTDNVVNTSTSHEDEEVDFEAQLMEEIEELDIMDKMENPYPVTDWITYIYQDVTEIQQQDKFFGITCAVKVKRDTLLQQDIKCSVSHENEDLKSCLKHKEEKLLSFIVSVKVSKYKEDPIVIFVPCHSTEDTLEHVIRISTEKGEWNDYPSGPCDSIPGVSWSCFHRSELHLETETRVVVISRHRRCHHVVPEDGVVLEPNDNRNLTLLISPGTFKKETNISFSTGEVKPDKIKTFAQTNSEFQNIHSIDTWFHLHCEDFAADEISIIFYDLLREEDSADNVLPIIQRDSLRRCWRRLVNEMDTVRLIRYLESWGIQPTRKFDKAQKEESGLVLTLRKKLQAEQTKGDKARLLLKEMERCSLEDFNSFITCLRESNQPHLAQLLTEEVFNREKQNRPDSETKRAAKHDLRILVRRGKEPWVVTKPQTITDMPDDLLVVLPSRGKDYQVMIMNVTGETSNRDLSIAADVISGDTDRSWSTVICRQHFSNPENIIIQCVRSELAPARVRYLKEIGFTKSIEETVQFGICDGETIDFTFDLNIGLTEIGEEGPLRLHYFSYLDTAQFLGELFIVDDRAQSQEPCYFGIMYYNVGSVKQVPPRSGEVIIKLPKTAAPYVDRTPFRLMDTEVIALAKYIGFRIGSRGRDTLLQFAEELEKDDSVRRRIYVKVRRVCRKKDDIARCELFIINWARQRYKFENKVILLLDALSFDPDLQADTKDFSLVFSPSGIFCDDNLIKMSEFIGEEWCDLGRKLCVPEKDINFIRAEYRNQETRNYQLLDTFRFSRMCIEQGTGVIRFLLRACKETGCNSELVSFIRFMTGIFKEQKFMRRQSWLSKKSIMTEIQIA